MDDRGSDTDRGVGSELWIVRHGATEWSRSMRHTSVTDVALTAAGEHAARGLAERLSAVEFDLVLTSPMRRAVETATLAGFAHPERDDDLREWAYGDYEGRTTSEIRERVPDWTVWTHPSPGGESASEVAARADRIVARARTGMRRTLVFTHGHVGRPSQRAASTLPTTDGSMFLLDTGAVSVLGWDRELPSIQRWNA